GCRPRRSHGGGAAGAARRRAWAPGHRAALRRAGRATAPGLCRARCRGDTVDAPGARVMSTPLFATMPATGIVCGVDEAGRGPLAGPVYAAAVVLDPARPVDGLRDSKRLSPAQRDRLAILVRQRAVGWAIASA